MHPYGSPTHCVLHVDVDSFFCQVEELRCPSLAGRPLAIQQHQDVIAVNYPGRAAGVKKHMPPPQARTLLSAAGGLLVHVFTEPDGRVSYRPYREASAALMRLLSSGLPPAAAACVAVVEKASIDEAYLLVALTGSAAQQPAAQGASVALPDMPAWVSSNAALAWDCSLGADVAAAVRAAAKAQLGLTVSVGVAPNKLLAKLVSRAAKPDSVHVVGGVAAVQALLAATPVDKLPGLGGVAPALQRLGITTAQQLQAHSAAGLASLLGGQQQARLAGRLAEAGWGRDEGRVVDKGPAKSLQVQMTLTPQVRPLPPNLQAAGRGPIAGQAPNAAGGGMLVPLLTGAPDTAPRLAAVLGAMAGDLLGRVMLDRHVEDRWPRKLALTLTTSGNPPRSATRSTTFPTPALAGTALPSAPSAAAATNSPATVAAGSNGSGMSGAGPEGAAQAPAAAAAAAFDAPGVVGEKRYAASSALHAAVVNLAAGLAQVLVAPLPAGHPVTILNLTASNFGPYEAAAASGSIRRFTTAAAGPTPAAAAAAAAAAAVGAAATAPAAALPPAAPAAPENNTAPSLAVSLRGEAHAPTPQQQQLQRTEPPSMQQEQQRHRQQAWQQSEDDDVVLVEQQAASLNGVGTTAAQGDRHTPQPSKLQQQQQPQQQQRQQPAHGPSVVPAATHRPPKRKLAAAYDTTAAAPVQLDEPPVLLSQLLRQLASPRLSAAAVEQQLAALLAAAGGLGRLMPGQGEGGL